MLSFQNFKNTLLLFLTHLTLFAGDQILLGGGDFNNAQAYAASLTFGSTTPTEISNLATEFIYSVAINDLTGDGISSEGGSGNGISPSKGIGNSLPSYQ